MPSNVPYSFVVTPRGLCSSVSSVYSNAYISIYHFFWWRCGPTRIMAPSFMRFLDHTQRRITVGRTPLDELSARRRDLYLTTHNTHNRQTSMPSAGFEPTISAVEWPQSYALGRAATGTDPSTIIIIIIICLSWR